MSKNEELPVGCDKSYRGKRTKMDSFCFDYELCPKEILDEVLAPFESDIQDGQCDNQILYVSSVTKR